MTFPNIQSSSLTSDYRWSESAGRYIGANGQFVAFSDVRDALETVIDASAVRMNILTQSLVDGQIPLAEWQSGMLEQIKLAHTASAASARGGWAQMSQSDWGAAGRMIRTQYDYLHNFSNQIADGTQALDGRALVRADLYGDAPRGTFEAMRQRYETLMNGMEEEIRILGEADHCDGCLEQAALGWQPMGTLDAIGDEECLTRCHCTKKFRKVGPDGEWMESEEE